MPAQDRSFDEDDGFSGESSQGIDEPDGLLSRDLEGPTGHAAGGAPLTSLQVQYSLLDRRPAGAVTVTVTVRVAAGVTV